MPRVARSVDEEEEAFNACIQRIEEWWRSPKQAHLKRPYTAARVAGLRSNLEQKYASSDMAEKLWKQMHEHDAKGTHEMTFGTTDPIIASQIAKYSQTLYVSGSLCNSSETYEPGADHADYPWDTVPKVVEKLFRGQQWQDQRQRHYRMLHSKEERAKMDEWDYLTPIIADGDMGFGGLTSTVKLTKLFVESGVAMFHLDDLAIGCKKFTTGEGRTVIPLSEYEDRLIAARLQIDIMGAETLLCGRCDIDDSEYITNVTDPRDHEYIQGATVPIESLEKVLRAASAAGKSVLSARKQWISDSGLSTFDEAVQKVANETEFAAYKAKLGEQTVPIEQRRVIAEATVSKPVFFDWDLARIRGGQYFYKTCVKAMIERAVAVAPLTDVTWGRMDAPKWEKIEKFHQGMRAIIPDRLFLFGYTGQYDYAKAGFTEEMVKNMGVEMAKMGVVWQVQPVWAAQGMNMVVDEFAKMWAEEGIAAYVEKVQKPALAMSPNPDGFGKTSYRGAHFADGLYDAIVSRDY
ncbi:isocitrate lyase-3 [Coleophoma cylindrospora]|uniref:Isocitrate lyase n=1 Tax=Coleophoma cylindrospora TaxID=1849047 RepID=A0A3D8QL62_9HELO|nr:isocitrate lyase-3 [Coleophoma cylindrospora]